MGIQIYEGHDPKQVELEKGYPERHYSLKTKNLESSKRGGLAWWLRW